MQKTIWDKYAEVLVDYSTNVQKGDLVQIRATSIYAKELVKAVYKRVIQKGANPILRTSFEDFSDIFIKYASDEQLDYIDPMIKLEYETVNKFISIGAPMNTKNMARADLGKLARRSKASQGLSKTLMDRTAKGEASWVIADVPTHALAQEAKMSFDEYSEFLFKSCYLDLDDPVAKLRELDEKQTKWANYLNGVKKVRIVGDRTDITFGVEGRKWISCSGVNNYPDGEVFTSPVEQDVTIWKQCSIWTMVQRVLAKLLLARTMKSKKLQEIFFLMKKLADLFTWLSVRLIRKPVERMCQDFIGI